MNIIDNAGFYDRHGNWISKSRYRDYKQACKDYQAWIEKRNQLNSVNSEKENNNEFNSSR